MPKGKAQKATGEYTHELNPQGYLNNREITNLPGRYLVKGSKNCLIVNAEKVSSRKGYELLGASKTMNKGIRSSFEWDTSTATSLAFRSYYDRHEIWWKSAWRIFEEGLSNVDFSYTTWWNNTEKLDVLLYANGGNYVKEWSGAVVEIASVTDSTLTKKGYLKGIGGAGDSFIFTDDGVNNATVRKLGGGFTGAGFAAGDKITISGSTSNDGNYTIKEVTDDQTLTLDDDDILVSETSTAQVIVKWTIGGTWAEARALSVNAGDDNDRAFTINSVKYVYTGGEDTGTLTGLVVSPVGNVSAGDIAYQTPRTYSPSALTNFTIDIVFMIQNQVVYASKSSRVVYISTNSDITSFAESTLRLPGEGAQLQLDSCPTAVVPGDPNKQTLASKDMYISAGTEEWYHVTFVKSTANDGSGVSKVSETTNVDKIEHAAGSAAISQDAVVHVKNGVIVVTKEPTIDLLSRIVGNVADSLQTQPLSDAIKLDIESYDLTGAQGVYYKRNLYLTLPAEGVIVIRDFINNYWQPPQTITLSRLAIIEVDGEKILCGHSAGSNETYKLFVDGVYNDNGAKFPIVMAFGYENFGTRFQPKNFDEISAELYISPSTLVKDRVLYDYLGATDIREWDIDGNDSRIQFMPNSDVSLGSDPLGSEPLGSSQNDMGGLLKVRVIHQTTRLDFYERQRVFYSNSQDARFEVLVYGENVEMSDNLPTFIKE